MNSSERCQPAKVCVAAIVVPRGDSTSTASWMTPKARVTRTSTAATSSRNGTALLGPPASGRRMSSVPGVGAVDSAQSATSARLGRVVVRLRTTRTERLAGSLTGSGSRARSTVPAMTSPWPGRTTGGVISVRVMALGAVRVAAGSEDVARTAATAVEAAEALPVAAPVAAYPTEVATDAAAEAEAGGIPARASAPHAAAKAATRAASLTRTPPGAPRRPWRCAVRSGRSGGGAPHRAGTRRRRSLPGRGRSRW